MSSGYPTMRKRERMVTLRVNDTSFGIIRDYATNHGLTFLFASSDKPLCLAINRANLG
jgi:hypothetical protein